MMKLALFRIISSGKLIHTNSYILTRNHSHLNNLIHSLPHEAYTDSRYYDIEKKNLLGNSWQLFSHVSLLTKQINDSSISYITETIAGWPIIVIRSNKNGEIYAYQNVCRHKAGPLEWNDTSGICNLNGLKCKYHGWIYSIDGKLKGIPGFNCIDNLVDPTNIQQLDKSKYNLWPLRVVNWKGLIFIQIKPDNNTTMMYGKEAYDLFINENKEFCNRLDGVFNMSKSSIEYGYMNTGGIQLEKYTYYSSKTHKLNCNWKVYVENYLEPYHIPTIHPELNKQVDMKKYMIKVNNDGRYVEHLVPTTSSAYDGLWLWYYPTLAINCYNGGISLERIVPTSTNTTEIRYIYLFDQSMVDMNDKQKLHAIQTSSEVTAEDIQICEAVQLGLQSGSYVSPGVLSPRYEQGVQYFQQLIRNIHSHIDT